MADGARAPCILVGDDDDALRGFLFVFLQGEGYTVRLAANGREALTDLDHLLPDLVFTDMQMPIMDGGALCAQLPPRTPPFPVIVMSAGMEPRRAAEADGADGWLAKPFDLDHLLALVQRGVGQPPCAALS